MKNPKNLSSSRELSSSKALLALAFGGFGLGMTEFLIMGILPQVAGSLHISIPTAGHFISAYALGVVIGAPVMTALAGKYPAHRVLVALMIWFTIFNSLSALATGYQSLLLARFLSGLPHGAYFGIGAVVAGRLAPPGRAASAAATMFAGLTVANVIGVPLGTFVGQTFGWKLAFALVGLAGVNAVVGLTRWLPPLPAASTGGLGQDLALLGKLEFWLVTALTVLGTGGFFAWYSYVAPLLTEVSGFASTSVIPIMMVAGVGMTVGNHFGAKLADRYSPIRAGAVLLLAMSLALGILTFVAASKVWALFMTFAIGGIAFSLVTPIQFTMIGAAEGSEMMGSAINQSAFNMGNALGAYLGGLPIALGYGLLSADWVGAGLAFSGVLLALGIMAFQGKRTHRPA